MAYPPYPSYPPADPNGQPSYPQQPAPGQPYQPYYPPPASATAPPSQPYYPYPQPSAAPPSQPYYPYPQSVAAPPPSQPYYQPQTGSPGYPYYQQPAPPQQAKRSPLLILLAVVVLVAIAGGGWYFLSHRTANIAGTWQMTFTTTSPSYSVEDDHLTIQQNGDQVTVRDSTITPSGESVYLDLTGHVSGSDVEFDFVQQNCSLRMPGAVSDSNHMAGSWTTQCSSDPSETYAGTWKATRISS